MILEEVSVGASELVLLVIVQAFCEVGDGFAILKQFSRFQIGILIFLKERLALLLPRRMVAQDGRSIIVQVVTGYGTLNHVAPSIASHVHK